MNIIWVILISTAFITAAATGRMESLTDGLLEAAKTAVELGIGLIGVMALWLGLMRIAEDAGLVKGLARLISPVMRRLFPEVPPDHPAMGGMVANIAANMLGLGNSATALGLKVMQDLQSLNRDKSSASNAMATFLAINTSSVTLVPATIIGIRVAAGSNQPTEIIGPILVATGASTFAGIIAAKLLERLKPQSGGNPRTVGSNNDGGA